MNYQELQMSLAQLNQVTNALEDTYINQGGEVTEETMSMEEEISALQQLVTTEGIDLLGGWLKSKEDRRKALKAESDHIKRQMDAIDKTIDFIKGQVTRVMAATGMEKLKGDRGYSFTAYTSVSTSVDKQVLNAMYMAAVEKKLRGGKSPVIPADVTVTLGASVKALPEGTELPGYYSRSEEPSVKFAKPRAAKEA